MRRLQQHDLQVRRAQARAEGRQLGLEPSEQEAEFLDRQRHDYLSDWSPQEQEKFKREQGQLWALIPEQFRSRATKMATGQWVG